MVEDNMIHGLEVMIMDGRERHAEFKSNSGLLLFTTIVALLHCCIVALLYC